MTTQFRIRLWMMLAGAATMAQVSFAQQPAAPPTAGQPPATQTPVTASNASASSAANSSSPGVDNHANGNAPNAARAKDAHVTDVRAAEAHIHDARGGDAHINDTPDDLSPQLLTIRRVFVDRLTGGETAAQLRDIIIAALQGAKLFILTENQERADVILRGAAEDLIFTDQFQSSDGINMHGGAASSSGTSTDSRYNGAGSGFSDRSSRSVNLGVGENDSTNIKERRHEALATVRLVNKDGDVIWSTTQESTGAKFRGASADVAEKITRQLIADYDKARNRGKPQQRPQ